VVCPIGLPGLKSKAPEVIAVSVAADLLMRIEAARLVPVPEFRLASV
jgi:xanthine dehydrogenase accessory factor